MALSLSSTTSFWSRFLRVAGWAVALGSATVTAGMLVERLLTGEGFYVREVRVAGNTHVSEVALRHLSDVRSGEHLWRVDLGRAVRNIEAHPWVAHAQARRVFPGVVEISVTEREPLLLLSLDRLWYVDRTGKPFRVADASDLDYPVLTGLDPWLASSRPDLARAVIKGAVRVLDDSDTAGHIARGELSEIHFDGALGFELVLRTGTRVVLGFDDPTPAFGRLMTLVGQGVDLHLPLRVDLGGDRVAIVSPLPTPSLP